MKTINEKRGYQFSNGAGGKKWRRGNVQFSEGRMYTDAGNIYLIVKTDLTTGAKEVASLKEHKRFLTPEGYEEYLNGAFVKLHEMF